MSREAVTNFGQYMAKYHPARWGRWVHLMIHHDDLADRPCGLPRKGNQ